MAKGAGKEKVKSVKPVKPKKEKGKKSKSTRPSKTPQVPLAQRRIGSASSLTKVADKIGGKSGIDWSRLDAARKAETTMNRGPSMFGRQPERNDDEYEGKSKIYKALNPQKLYYESRKDRLAADDDDNVMVVQVRGNDARTLLDQDKQTVMRDEFGNIVETQDDDADEEDFDATNLPDFDDDTREEMRKRREKREQEAAQHRADLKKKADAKRKEKLKAVEKELAVIAKKEAGIKKKSEITDKDVEQTRKKLDEELEFNFGFGDLE